MNKTILVVLLIVPILSVANSIDKPPRSGEGENGFGLKISAVGVDGEKRIITGFYHVLNNVMPGRSFNANCKIIFSGKMTGKYPVTISANSVSNPLAKPILGELFFDGEYIYTSNSLPEQKYRLKLNENFPGCSDDNDISSDDLQFSINKIGQWKKVSSVRSGKAHFYQKPDESTKKNAFLVEGDILYVYDENLDWYYVKYQGQKAETVGWVKKTDALQ